jgi:hypothetical protein
MQDRAGVASVVLTEIHQYLAEEGAPDAALEEHAELIASGFDSLGFAVLVTRLEASLGWDPFEDAEDIVLPRTVGDLIDVYHDSQPVHDPVPQV